MARNVEIKARVEDLDKLRRLVQEISDSSGEFIIQEDVFFNSPKGRLKLRILAPGFGQLIHYEREDTCCPKQSSYLISTTMEPDSLIEVLSACLGVRGVVRKRRELYMVGRTRIHLDEVEGLGSFLELEVVLDDDQSTAEGEVTATAVMAQLAIEQEHLVSGAYIDLIEGTKPSG